ncbi:MAG: acylneuraminate cytidylyltransferase family protein [Candidatus Aenigmatarchaeota archaeon]|nr:MAG: acylneuraminate cytidylyltransferase family protein [Candidatus Aenigmarchaeota archaeon]
MVKVLGIIPARRGSKRIPDKNLKELAGKPLVSYVIEEALKSKNLDRVVVSTEDEEIAKVARRFGAEVLMRPEELARDDVPLVAVAKHVMESFDKIGEIFDIIVSIQPTNPFIEAKDIDEGIEKIIDSGCDSVVSVTRIIGTHPMRAYRREGDRLYPFSEITTETFLQRQDLPEALGFTGSIYIRKRELLERWDGKGFALGNDIRYIYIEPERAVDINEPIDFILAEAIMRGKHEDR